MGLNETKELLLEIRELLNDLVAAGRGPEEAVYRPDIRKVLGWGESKLNYMRRELHEVGAIFYQWEGMPKRKVMKAFPSRLQRYLHAKSRKAFPFKTTDKRLREYEKRRDRKRGRLDI